MPILENAEHGELARLLALFPLTNLKLGWPSLKGKKEELCAAIATEKEVGRIIKFISKQLTCCRLHVYVFEKPAELPDLSASIPGGDLVHHTADSQALFIAKVKFNVILKEPLENDSIEFLWPIQIEIGSEFVVVRFVVLEPNPSIYFSRGNVFDGRSLDEQTIVHGLRGLGLKNVDLHRGIKALWAEDYMDAIRVKYKTPNSRVDEVMDEAKGIKANYPSRYQELQGYPLTSILFLISPAAKCSVSALHAAPLDGRLAFPRYTEVVGDTDVVVKKVVASNK